MIPFRIKDAIEANPALNEQLLANGLGLDWKKFNRTVFDFIARRINKKVSYLVCIKPYLVSERHIIGHDQFRATLFKQKLSSEEDFIHHLTTRNGNFTWISSKTLHSYWNNGKAKATKLHVLLTFLEVEIAEWENWKKLHPSGGFRNIATRISRKIENQQLLKSYYLGSYFLYYQKSDNSEVLVKAPFIIGLDERSQVYAETITEGHPYKSSLIEIRDGILYIHCENQLFNEKENHIFNVGNETNPEVIFGISNTISTISKMPIGIRNVLIKQQEHFTKESFKERELFLSSAALTDEQEGAMLRYFRKQTSNLISADYCCTLEALKNR